MPLLLRQSHICNRFFLHWFHEARNILSVCLIIWILNVTASSALGALEWSYFEEGVRRIREICKGARGNRTIDNH